MANFKGLGQSSSPQLNRPEDGTQPKFLLPLKVLENRMIPLLSQLLKLYKLGGGGGSY